MQTIPFFARRVIQKDRVGFGVVAFDPSQKDYEKFNIATLQKANLMRHKQGSRRSNEACEATNQRDQQASSRPHNLFGAKSRIVGYPLSLDPNCWSFVGIDGSLLFKLCSNNPPTVAPVRKATVAVNNLNVRTAAI